MSERAILQVLCPVRIDSLSKVCDTFPKAFIRNAGSVVWRGENCNVIELFFASEKDDVVNGDTIFKLNNLVLPDKEVQG